MTKTNAEIVLEKEPYEMIKWFTLNYDKEIGAVGIGRIEQQKVIVEELFFPTQEVSVATVHINSTDWGPIVKEIAKKYGEDECVEKLKKINFYWHKHPTGSAKPSSTDEESTFDAFMDEEQKRKYFAFLQTCKKSYGVADIEWEPRIEMRTPIKHTIENVRVVTRELSGIESACKKILETKIKKPEPVKAVVTHSPRNVDYNRNWKKDQYDFNTSHYLTCNDIAEEEGIDYNFKNGHAIIEVHKDYKECVEKELRTGSLKPLLQRFKVIRGTDTIRYLLYPGKKCYSDLVDAVKDLNDTVTNLHNQRAIDAMNGTFYDINQLTLEDVAEGQEQAQLKAYEKELAQYEKANKSILKDRGTAIADNVKALKTMMEK